MKPNDTIQTNHEVMTCPACGVPITAVAIASLVYVVVFSRNAMRWTAEHRAANRPTPPEREEDPMVDPMDEAAAVAASEVAE